MQLCDKVIVVTGGAGGIGAALCRRFAAEGARSVVVADRDAEGARRVAAECGGLAIAADVTSEPEVVALVEQATATYGPIDLFCSNAGIITAGGVELPDAQWQRIWDVNVMAHIYAARAVLPGMLARGAGYLLQTASAAGLLTQIGSAPYAVTKHAAVALAEWLAITYGGAGIKVSCLCPQGVSTEMLNQASGGIADLLRETAMTPEAVADAVVAALAEERFLILPHPEVAEYFRRKASDHEPLAAGHAPAAREAFRGRRHERPGAGAARPGLVFRRRLRPALAGRRGAGAAAGGLLDVAPATVVFDEVYVGPRRRQQQTADLVAARYRSAGRRWPDPIVLEELDEYDLGGLLGRLAPSGFRAAEDRGVRGAGRQGYHRGSKARPGRERARTLPADVRVPAVPLAGGTGGWVHRRRWKAGTALPRPRAAQGRAGSPYRLPGEQRPAGGGVPPPAGSSAPPWAWRWACPTGPAWS